MFMLFLSLLILQVTILFLLFLSLDFSYVAVWLFTIHSYYNFWHFGCCYCCLCSVIAFIFQTLRICSSLLSINIFACGLNLAVKLHSDLNSANRGVLLLTHVEDIGPMITNRKLKVCVLRCNFFDQRNRCLIFKSQIITNASQRSFMGFSLSSWFVY